MKLWRTRRIVVVYTGEIRSPQPGEFYVADDGKIDKCIVSLNAQYEIVQIVCEENAGMGRKVDPHRGKSTL